MQEGSDRAYLGAQSADEGWTTNDADTAEAHHEGEEENPQSKQPREKRLPSEPRTVQVVFIRHAETEENVKVQAAVSILKSLGQFQLPSWGHVTKALSLLAMNEDSPLTSKGQHQLQHMKKTLESIGFWSKFDFDLCAYSPYIRAKSTALALIPESKHPKCVELSYLTEVSPFEHFYSNKLPQRIEELEKWIANCYVDRLVLVGHCKYFQELLCTNTFMWNVDIWKAEVTFPAAGHRGVAVWSEPQLVARSPFASPHPADGLAIWEFFKQYSKKKKRKERKSYYSSSSPFASPGSAEGWEANSADRAAQGADRANETTKDDEPICRICQASYSEMPDVKLIRPCMCSGSQAFVHQDCLNQWRATSTEAFQKCSICKYEYHIKRSLVAQFLANPITVATITILAFCVVFYLLGTCLQWLTASGVLPVRSYSWLQQLVGWPYERPQACVILDYIKDSRPKRKLPSSDFSHFMLSLRCDAFWAPILGRILSGLVAAGIFSQIGYYGLYLLRMHRHDQGQFMAAVGVTFFWFNASDIDGTMRVWLLMGLYFLLGNSFSKLSERARHWTQSWFGDQVLDVE